MSREELKSAARLRGNEATSLAMTGNLSRTGMTHTKETKELMSSIKNGALNPNWRGGVLERQRQLDKTRVKVLDRDHRSCVWCNDTYDLVIHHMIPRDDDPSLICDEDNCVTLCRSCHMKAHKDDLVQ